MARNHGAGLYLEIMYVPKTTLRKRPTNSSFSNFAHDTVRTKRQKVISNKKGKNTLVRNIINLREESFAFKDATAAPQFGQKLLLVSAPQLLQFTIQKSVFFIVRDGSPSWTTLDHKTIELFKLYSLYSIVPFFDFSRHSNAFFKSSS